MRTPRPSAFESCKKPDPDINDQIAAFFASGKKITRVDMGVTSVSQNLTRREQNEQSMTRRVELTLGNKREA